MEGAWEGCHRGGGGSLCDSVVVLPHRVCGWHCTMASDEGADLPPTLEGSVALLCAGGVLALGYRGEPGELPGHR